MSHSSWLYIIFTCDFTEDPEPATVFETIKNSFRLSERAEHINVIIIKNSFLKLRPLLNKGRKNEIKVLGKNTSKEHLFFCETTVHECSFNNEKETTKKDLVFNYWQKAFDYVFKEYKADNYILHTYSHSNGFEINGTEEGFVLNGCGNLLKRKSTFPVNQSKSFTKYFNKIIKERESQLFLRGFTKPLNSNTKNIKKLNPKKIPIKKWSICNSTNGLLLYDFADYLSTQKIKFKFIFLQNCNAFLLDNIYYLKNWADAIIGPTGFIDKELQIHETIYNVLLRSNNSESIKTELIKNLAILMAPRNKEERLLVAETKNLDVIFNYFTKIILSLTRLYKKNEEHTNRRRNSLAACTGLRVSPISQFSALQYYDIIDLLNEIAGADNEILELIKTFERICNEHIYPLHSSGINNASISFPYQDRYKSLSHLRSIYRKPYSNFSEKTHYSNLITTLFLE